MPFDDAVLKLRYIFVDGKVRNKASQFVNCESISENCELKLPIC